MMDKAELFCGNPLRTLREESTKYLTESDSLEDTND